MNPDISTLASQPRKYQVNCDGRFMGFVYLFPNLLYPPLQDVVFAQILERGVPTLGDLKVTLDPRTRFQIAATATDDEAILTALKCAELNANQCKWFEIEMAAPEQFTAADRQ